MVAGSAAQKLMLSLAKEQENVQRFLGDASIRKVIVVPNKLVNIVAQ